MSISWTRLHVKRARVLLSLRSPPQHRSIGGTAQKASKACTPPLLWRKKIFKLYICHLIPLVSDDRTVRFPYNHYYHILFYWSIYQYICNPLLYPYNTREGRERERFPNDAVIYMRAYVWGRVCNVKMWGLTLWYYSCSSSCCFQLPILTVSFLPWDLDTVGEVGQRQCCLLSG